jgi:hypothetical protein
VRLSSDSLPSLPLLTFSSLSNPTDVQVISKFAQLEFKLGDAERGRTIFEGIIDSYPKRLDLWFVYIDMETKQRNVAAVRALFDRVLAQRLSSSASSFPSPSFTSSDERFFLPSREGQVRLQEVAVIREGLRR